MIRALPPYWFNLSGKTQRPTVSADSGGGRVYTYADNLTSLSFRANIPSGDVEARQNRMDGTKVYKIFTPGGLDIIAGDRIVYNSRVFDIKAIRDVDESGVFLTIDAVEVLPATVVA